MKRTFTVVNDEKHTEEPSTKRRASPVPTGSLPDWDVHVTGSQPDFEEDYSDSDPDTYARIRRRMVKRNLPTPPSKLEVTFDVDDSEPRTTGMGTAASGSGGDVKEPTTGDTPRFVVITIATEDDTSTYFVQPRFLSEAQLKLCKVHDLGSYVTIEVDGADHDSEEFKVYDEMSTIVQLKAEERSFRPPFPFLCAGVMTIMLGSG